MVGRALRFAPNEAEPRGEEGWAPLFEALRGYCPGSRSVASEAHRDAIRTGRSVWLVLFFF